MIGIGKAMRFVADSLEQMQRARIRRQLQRQGVTGAINLLVFFSQANDRQIVQTEPLQLVAGGRKLSFPSIHDDQIWQSNSCEIRIADCGLRIVFFCDSRRRFEGRFLRKLR